MATVFRILCECQNHHQSDFDLIGVSREMASDYCGLIDGTSPMYLYPPGPESNIGKCAICGAPFRARIESEGISEEPVPEACIRIRQNYRPNEEKT